MSNNFQLVELPGKGDFRVATTDNPNKEHAFGIKSPEWMVKIDDLTISDIDGYPDYVELFGWQGEASCLTNPVSSGNSFGSSTLRHTDLVFIIPFGGHSAKLETKMNRCENIESIKIIHVGNVIETKVLLQEIEFNTCRIQRCQQQLDRMIIHAMISIRTNTVHVYDPTGLCTGKMVSKTDYVKNKAE
jgi:hypothetical protein